MALAADRSSEVYAIHYSLVEKATEGIMGVTICTPAVGRYVQIAVELYHEIEPRDRRVENSGNGFKKEPLELFFKPNGDVLVRYNPGIKFENACQIGDPDFIEIVRSNILSWRKYEIKRRRDYEISLIDKAVRETIRNEAITKKARKRLEALRRIVGE
jgi:hypothetical protein